jgi:integrase
MGDYRYKSLFGRDIETFINQKRASGHIYQASALILYRFDDFAHKKFPAESQLTKEICMEWIKSKPGEHPNGLARRITPVRQLGKYLNGIGRDAYVICDHIPNKQIRYEAHIYTKAELKAFFASVDRCLDSPFSPERKYVIPVLFRLLYCCGLRSSEARLLKCDDIDLETGKITIRESKGWKARIVYMSPELLEVCREYDSIIRKTYLDRQAFFPNMNGGFYAKSTIDCWFHEFWDKLPESKQISGNPARVHDFRHSYAVHRLNRWVKEKDDINALLPYLSEYMGHSNYADTDYYLRLVEEFYPEMEQMLTSVNADILPEVCHG